MKQKPTDSLTRAVIEIEQKIAELRDMIISLQTPIDDTIIVQSMTKRKGGEQKKVLTTTDSLKDVERVTKLPIIPLPSGQYLCTCQQCEHTRSWVTRELSPRCSNTTFRHYKWWLQKGASEAEELALPPFIQRLVARIPKLEKTKAKGKL